MILGVSIAFSHHVDKSKVVLQTYIDAVERYAGTQAPTEVEPFPISTIVFIFSEQIFISY